MMETEEEMVAKLLSAAAKAEGGKSMEELKRELLAEAVELSNELVELFPEERDSFKTLAKACDAEVCDEMVQGAALTVVVKLLENSAVNCNGLDKLMRIARVLVGSSFGLLGLFIHLGTVKVLYILLARGGNDKLIGDALDALRLCCSPAFGCPPSFSEAEDQKPLFELLRHGHNDHKVNVAVILSFLLAVPTSELRVREEILQAELVPCIVELTALEATDAYLSKSEVTGPAPLLTLLQYVVAPPNDSQRSSLGAIKKAHKAAMEAQVLPTLKTVLSSPSCLAHVRAKAAVLMNSIEAQDARWKTALQQATGGTEEGSMAAFAANVQKEASSKGSTSSACTMESIPAVIEMVSSSSQESQEAAVASINEMAANPEMREALLKAGTVKALTQLVLAGVSADVCTWATSALWHLVFAQPENFHHITVECVTALVTQVSQRNEGSSILSASILEQILMDSPKHRHLAVKQNLLLHAINLGMMDNGLAQGEAFAVLHSLAQDVRTCEVMVNNNCIELLLSVAHPGMNVHKPKARLQALRTLATMVNIFPASRELPIKCGGIPPLVASIQGPEYDEQARHAAVIVAFAAATSTKRRVELCKGGVVEAFIEMFKMASGEMKTMGCEGLKHVAFEMPDAQMKIRNAGLIPELLEISQTSVGSENRAPAMAIMCHLCASDKIREDIKSQGGVDIMIELLESDDRDIRSYASHALFQLSGTDLVTQAAIVRRGAVAQFKDIENTGNEHGRKAAGLMVKKLQMNAKRIQEIVSKQQTFEKRNDRLLEVMAGPSKEAAGAATKGAEQAPFALGLAPGMRVKILVQKGKKDAKAPTSGTVTWFDNEKRKWAVELDGGGSDIKLYGAKELAPADAAKSGDDPKAGASSSAAAAAPAKLSKKQKQRERERQQALVAAAAAAEAQEKEEQPPPEPQLSMEKEALAEPKEEQKQERQEENQERSEKNQERQEKQEQHEGAQDDSREDSLPPGLGGEEATIPAAEQPKDHSPPAATESSEEVRQEGITPALATAAVEEPALQEEEVAAEDHPNDNALAEDQQTEEREPVAEPDVLPRMDADKMLPKQDGEAMEDSALPFDNDRIDDSFAEEEDEDEEEDEGEDELSQGKSKPAFRAPDEAFAKEGFLFRQGRCSFEAGGMRAAGGSTLAAVWEAVAQLRNEA